MKRYLLFCVMLVLLFAQASEAAMTYGADHYRQNKGRVFAGNYNVDPIWLFMNEVETSLEGGGGVDSLVFTPGTVPATASEGEVYYNDASDVLMLYTTSWKTIDLAGTATLAQAYAAGSKITADTLAVEIEVSDSANNAALLLDYDDATTNAMAVLIIENAGDDADAVSIQIDGQSAGYDIQGTGDVWDITTTGVATLVGATIDDSDLVFTEPTTNDITLLADGDGILTISAGSMEDIDLNLATSDYLTVTSSTGLVNVDWGAVDNHIGLNALAFDGAVANTITQTGTGTGDDLTISQAGSVDASLDLRSAGTGADAIKIYASAGGLDVDTVADTIHIQNAATGDGEDITIALTGATNSSIVLTSAGNAGDAMSFITTSATGDFNIDSADEMDIDSVGSILMDISEAGANLEVDSAGGSIYLDAGEAAADAIVIAATTAAGGIDITSNADIDITTTGEAGEDINITNTGGSIAISATENIAGAITIGVNGGIGETIAITATQSTADAALDLNATAGGIDMDAAKSIYLTSTENSADSVKLQSTLGGIDILCDASDGEALDIVNTGGPLNLKSTEEGDATIHIETTTATGQLQITVDDTSTDAIQIDVLGGIEINAAEDITMTLTAGVGEDFVIQTSGATDHHLKLISAGTSADALLLDCTNAAGGIDMDAGTTGIDVDCTGGTIAIDNSGASKDITIDSTQGSIKIDAGESAVDALQLLATAGGIDITATSGGSAEDIDITATGGSVNIIANESAAQTIVIATSGGGSTAETIDITNDTGTAASATTQTDAAIQIEASAGGISLESGLSGADAIRLETSESGALTTIQSISGTGASATGEEDATIQLYAQAGGIGLASGLAAADAVRIEAQGADGQITIQNKLGTTASVATEFDASIQLYSEVGGIGLHSKLNGADAIRIEEGGGTGGTINIHANTGNAVADGAASINLLSDVGGIGLKATGLASANAIWIQAAAGGVNIDAQAAYDVDIDGGQIFLTSSHNVADAIKIHSDSGGNANINILNDECTTTSAITVTSSAGGINMDAADDIDIQLNATGADEDILITTAGTQDSHITITADGSDDNALGLIASVAGIDIDAAGKLTMDADDDMTITLAAGAGDEDLTITNTGNQDASILIIAEGSGTDALSLTTVTNSGDIVINSNDKIDMDSTGTFALNAAGDTLLIQVDSDGADDDLTIKVDGDDDSSIILDSDGSGADAISIQASHATTGGIDVDFKSGNLTITGSGASADVIVDCDLFSIDGTGTANITVAATAPDENLTISQTGTNDSSLLLASSGTGADALSLDASAGVLKLDGDDGIDIDGGSNGDITIDTSKSITITTTEAAATDQFKVDATGVLTGDGDAINLETTNGGILLNADGADYGDIEINAADVIDIISADTINIGASAVAQVIDIGNETGASSLSLLGGTGNIDIQGVAATTITIGDAAQTGAITIGASTATMTDLSLGTGVGAHTIHIGDGGTAAQVITIGSTSAASALTLQAGTGNFVVDGVAATTYTIGNSSQTGTMKFGESDASVQIDIGTGTGAKAINIGTGGTGAKTIGIGDGASTGTITVNAGSGGVTFSDGAITNVGDIDCDDIIADANDNQVISAVKMLVVSISVDNDPATDFQYDNTQENKTEQGIRVAILPANCMVNSVFVKCTETLTTGGQFATEIGTTDEGNEILTTSNCDTANDVMGTAAGETPEVAAGTAAIEIWVNGTPTTNDFDEISAGSWDVCIVYTDYAAALTQTGT
jgi:hypothetical protein